MNPNIKVITPNLWTVNFSYVTMNFIRELSFDKSTANDFMTLTNDGKLIMNSGDQTMMRYLPVLKVAMALPNRLLSTEKGFCIYIKAIMPSLDRLTNAEVITMLKKHQAYDPNKLVFETACKWEKARRQLQREYNRKHWFSILLRKLFQKGG